MHDPVPVPVGINAPAWLTVRAERTVLLVVHNTTTLNRLLDVVGIFESDLRIQLVATSSLTDPFSQGLYERLSSLGLKTIPWIQAVHTQFDLIVSASHHGNVADLHGPLVVLSHGIGYTKFSPGTGNREPGTGNREPGTGNRERSVFGLSRQWLLYDGAPIADALVFSHPEQVERVASQVPEAAHTAILAGDPCFDRMLASLPDRARFRAALGVPRDRTLVVVSSTWARQSLLGAWPQLIRNLLSELPVDDFQLAMVAHPNITDAHGSFQLESWFADCTRAGLTIIPPLHGWQAALIAADCVIGDFGSTSCYAAAIGRPVLLASFPEDQVAAGTAVHRLGALAPRLRHDVPLRPQIEAAIAGYRPARYAEIAELTSAVPGEAAARLRGLSYRLLALPEPATEPMLSRYGTAGLRAPATPRVSAALVATDVDTDRRTIRLDRYPAEPWPPASPVGPDARTHLAVHHRHPSNRLLELADVLLGSADDDAPDRPGALLSQHPAARIAAVPTDAGCRVHTRDGATALLTAEPGIDPAVLASAAYTWLCTGRPVAAADGCGLTAGRRTVRVSVRPR